MVDSWIYLSESGRPYRAVCFGMLLLLINGHVGDMARGFRQAWAAWNRFFSHLKETKWRSNHKRDNLYQTLAKNLVSSPLI
jgi:hypothetical protein